MSDTFDHAMDEYVAELLVARLRLIDEQERLDFVLNNDAFIVSEPTEDGGRVYQLWNSDSDERLWILSGKGFHKSPRAAIDAAIDIDETERVEVV